MDQRSELDVPDLTRALQAAKVHGCTSSRLHRHGADLVELLCRTGAPASIEAASAAETLLVRAAGEFGDHLRETLLHLLGLHRESRGFPLKTRRNFARKAFGRDPDDYEQWYSVKHFIETFEDDLLYDLAVEVWSLMATTAV